MGVYVCSATTCRAKRAAAAEPYIHDVFHVSLLKSFHSGGDGQDAPAPIVVDGEVEYEIDLIVRHRMSRGVC